MEQTKRQYLHTQHADKVCPCSATIFCLVLLLLSSGKMKNKLESTLAEFHDRTRRSKNIMVYNLKESKDSDVSRKRQHDLELVNKLFISILPTTSFKDIKTFRVGQKQPGKVRPLKVILDNAADVPVIIGKFRADSVTLVDPCFASVKLSRDRTPREV
ncbi:pre-mRNA-splicing factor cwc22 [Homalodisca vitripennis]|nr:pre-mRNA-splicing factor cwc22 [Homalodisca vitripennis]